MWTFLSFLFLHVVQQKRMLEDNVYKLSFFVPWVYLPAFCAILTFGDGFFRILWQQGLLLALTIGLLKLLQRGTYGDKQKMSALMLGINLSSIFWLAFSFPWFSGGEVTSTLYQIVTFFTVFMLLWCLYKTVTIDAGALSTSYDEKLANIRTLVESKSPVATKLCLTCLHRRPLRSKHCPELKACIARFDHYCPFTSNVIGAENHHFFLGFVFFAVVAIALVLLACWRALALQPEIASSTRGPLYWLWSVVHFEPVLFCVALLCIIDLLWIGYLLGFHLYLVLASLTTYEFVKNENMARAYSRGSALLNVVDFFRLVGAKRVDWKRVYSVEDYEASEMRAMKSKVV